MMGGRLDRLVRFSDEKAEGEVLQLQVKKTVQGLPFLFRFNLLILANL